MRLPEGGTTHNGMILPVLLRGVIKGVKIKGLR